MNIILRQSSSRSMKTMEYLRPLRPCTVEHLPSAKGYGPSYDARTPLEHSRVEPLLITLLKIRFPHVFNLRFLCGLLRADESSTRGLDSIAPPSLRFTTLWTTFLLILLFFPTTLHALAWTYDPWCPDSCSRPHCRQHTRLFMEYPNTAYPGFEQGKRNNFSGDFRENDLCVPGIYPIYPTLDNLVHENWDQ